MVLRWQKSLAKDTKQTERIVLLPFLITIL